MGDLSETVWRWTDRKHGRKPEAAWGCAGDQHPLLESQQEEERALERASRKERRRTAPCAGTDLTTDSPTPRPVRKNEEMLTAKCI